MATINSSNSSQCYTPVPSTMLLFSPSPHPKKNPPIHPVVPMMTKIPFPMTRLPLPLLVLPTSLVLLATHPQKFKPTSSLHPHLCTNQPSSHHVCYYGWPECQKKCRDSLIQVMTISESLASRCKSCLLVTVMTGVSMNH